MINSRIANNTWLQVVAFSDDATREISSFQARCSHSELKELIALLEAASARVYSYSMNHTTPEAKEDYEKGILIQGKLKLVRADLSTYSLFILFKSGYMNTSLEQLDPLIKSLKDLL